MGVFLGRGKSGSTPQNSTHRAVKADHTEAVWGEHRVSLWTRAQLLLGHRRWQLFGSQRRSCRHPGRWRPARPTSRRAHWDSPCPQAAYRREGGEHSPRAQPDASR